MLRKVVTKRVQYICKWSTSLIGTCRTYTVHSCCVIRGNILISYLRDRWVNLCHVHILHDAVATSIRKYLQSNPVQKLLKSNNWVAWIQYDGWERVLNKMSSSPLEKWLLFVARLYQITVLIVQSSVLRVFDWMHG